MTPDELKQLIAAGKPMRLVEALSPLTEVERRKLSKTATETLRDLRRQEREPTTAQMLGDALRQLSSRSWWRARDAQEMARLAVLGVGPVSQARRLEFTGFNDEIQQALLRILTDRRPDWIDEWIGAQLDREFPGIRWDTLRMLIRSGICRRPESDGYIRLMAHEMPHRFTADRKELPPLSRRLLDDAELLEHEVWRLFEIESFAFRYDEWLNDQNQDPRFESWTVALSRLASEGHIDRQRLLDSVLAGLTAGLSDAAMTGFMRFHDKLKPTSDELVARQPTYLDLLHSPAGHVVTFALKALKAADKAGKLDGSSFVEAVAPVFDTRTKTQPKSALTLLDRAVGRNPRLADGAARAVVAALDHESADVQERATKLLEKWKDRCGAFPADLIRDRVDGLTSTVRPLAEQLIADFVEIPAVSAVDVRTTAELDQLESELLRRARELPDDVREATGLDAALEALRNGTFPPPLELDPFRTGVLSGLRRIEPIGTVDELIDTVAHALETLDSAHEVDRIVDGISRLCDRRPQDFGVRTAALAKRLQAQPNETSRGLNGWSAPSAIRKLLLSWLTDDRTPFEWQYGETHPGPMYALAARLLECAGRVERRIAAPLLCAPTHEHGWIDPPALVQRVLEYQRRDLPPGSLDLIHALLRLAPDNRDQALTEAAEITGDAGRAIRWTLGGDEPPRPEDKANKALWAAAGRARQPRGRIDELEVLDIDPELPDVLTPATYTWQATDRVPRNRWESRHEQNRLALVMEPKLPDGPRHPAAVPLDDLLPQDEIGGLQQAIAQGEEDRTLLASASSLAEKFARSLQNALGVTTEQDAKRMKEFAWYPSACLHGGITAWVWASSSPWMIRWAASIWPLNTDAAFAAGAAGLARRIDMPSSMLEPNHVVLELLLEPNRPWTELARLALWLGLAGKDAEARSAAIDALIQGIEDGRAHPEPLARVLIRLSAGRWLKLNRIADGLAEVARTSALAKVVVAETLDRFLASLDPLPRDVHHVLSLSVELLTSLNSAPSPATLQRLSSLSGSNKSAKLARQLVGLESAHKSVELRRSRLEALAGRLARAERLADAEL